MLIGRRALLNYGQSMSDRKHDKYLRISHQVRSPIRSANNHTQAYQKIVIQYDCTKICTIHTLIKTTQPTSVPVQRPNSDLLLMPYYEWIIYLDKLTINFSLILSVVGPCSRNIKWILLVCWTPGILPPYWNDAAACIFSQLNNTRIQIPCHEA